MFFYIYVNDQFPFSTALIATTVEGIVNLYKIYNFSSLIF